MKKKLLIILVALSLLLSFGCESYVEHKTTFDSACGVWNLDCAYKNTHAISFTQTALTINEDGTGEIATATSEKDENGNAIVNVESIKVTDGKDSEGQAVLSITKADGTEKSYVFKVDEPAQLLHLYETDSEGNEYHYVYIDSEVEF